MGVGLEFGVDLFSEPLGTIASIIVIILTGIYLTVDIINKINRENYTTDDELSAYYEISYEKIIVPALCISVVLLYFFMFSFPSGSISILLAKETGNNAENFTHNGFLIIAHSINNIFVLGCFLLVLLMQIGFALLESGLIRSTNAINVIFKNFADFCIGSVFFFLIGYSLMWNTSDQSNVFVGNFELGWIPSQDYEGGIRPSIHFLFQLAFAMAAATICSGAVAGRIRLKAYFFATVFLSTLIYPVSGYWAWAEGGWLKAEEFHDLAGSSVVHGVGGFAALAGAIVLGPRIGRFPDDQRVEAALLARQGIETRLGEYRLKLIPPHNVSLAALGVFFLWIGWFGFNAGSEMPIVDLGLGPKDEAVDKVGNILINTLFAACGGAISSLFFAALVAPENVGNEDNGHRNSRRIDFASMLNGILGGLVIITASCDLVPSAWIALGFGLVAGFITVYVPVLLTLKDGRGKVMRVDDPVGAFAVHGVCGFVGTVACGIFAPSFGVQIVGALAICGWSFFVSITLFSALKMLGLLRVDVKSEYFGLDHRYHGIKAYEIGELK